MTSHYSPSNTKSSWYTILTQMTLMPASVAHLDAPSDLRPGGRGFNLRRGRQHFIRGDWSWNIFYGHSPPSADSRKAIVSFWQKNVHNTG